MDAALRGMRARLETHVIPKLSGSQLSLKQRLSEGTFGTVYVADAHGLPEYGKNVEDVSSGSKSLVAVKFLSDAASQEEK